MTKKAQEKIDLYSLGLDTPKWVMTGGTILKYIGTEMIMLDFTLEDTWKSETKRVQVTSIDNYDPMTQTYQITYLETQNDNSQKEFTTRIIPEGFEFGNPEETKKTKRFISYSEHFRRTEEELFWIRLKTLYNTNSGLNPDSLEKLSKNSKENIKDVFYISAIINTDTEDGINKGILQTRVTGLTQVTKKGSKDIWSFGFYDETGSYIQVPKYQDQDGFWVCKNFSYDGTILGDLKLIDLQG